MVLKRISVPGIVSSFGNPEFEVLLSEADDSYKINEELSQCLK